MAACLALVVTVDGLAGPAWKTCKGGTWSVPEGERALRQADAHAPEALAVAQLPGTGNAVRCLVETGPYSGPVGIRLGCDADGIGALDLVLGKESGQGVALCDRAGAVLWQDRFLHWDLYCPMWLEAIVEPQRVRVQVLKTDKRSLLAQSNWMALPAVVEQASPPLLGLVTGTNTARFCGWTRDANPLAAYDPNNPTALRLLQEGDDTWDVIGGGAWQWQDAGRNVLLQTQKTERTTAFMTAIAPAEGMWRCRIRLDKGTCGGGMLLHADRDFKQGFIVWLGGTYGNGCLMLYRYPAKCIWSGPTAKWKWDTDYMLEGVIEGDHISARFLEADGQTVITASPRLALLPEESGRRGMLGFQTWRGTGRFWSLGQDADSGGAVARAAEGQQNPLGADWTVRGGDWAHDAQRERVVQQRSTEGRAVAVCREVKGARGVFACTVTPRGATSVGFLFQLSPNAQQGFECRLAQGLEFRNTGDQPLWQDAAFAWEQGKAYRLEGQVMTDRVQVRVRDAAGELLIESVDRYVSDTNNDREGCIGFRTEGGAADFADWEWRAP